MINATMYDIQMELIGLFQLNEGGLDSETLHLIFEDYSWTTPLAYLIKWGFVSQDVVGVYHLVEEAFDD